LKILFSGLWLLVVSFIIGAGHAILNTKDGCTCNAIINGVFGSDYLPILWALFSILPIVTIDFMKQKDMSALPIKNIVVRGFSFVNICISKLIIGFCMILISLAIQVLTVIAASYIISLPFGTLPSSPPLLVYIFTTLIHYSAFFCLEVLIYIMYYFSSATTLKVISYIVSYAYTLWIVLPSLSSTVPNRHFIDPVIHILALTSLVTLSLLSLRRTEIK
jgi:hypothetical protein